MLGQPVAQRREIRSGSNFQLFEVVADLHRRKATLRSTLERSLLPLVNSGSEFLRYVVSSLARSSGSCPKRADVSPRLPYVTLLSGVSEELRKVLLSRLEGFTPSVLAEFTHIREFFFDSGFFDGVRFKLLF